MPRAAITGPQCPAARSIPSAGLQPDSGPCRSCRSTKRPVTLWSPQSSASFVDSSMRTLERKKPIPYVYSETCARIREKAEDGLRGMFQSESGELRNVFLLVAHCVRPVGDRAHTSLHAGAGGWMTFWIRPSLGSMPPATGSGS